MESFWPENLGQPSSSGSQDGMKYAVFPDKKRLVVQTGGTTKTYDTGDHRISGVSQSGGHGQSATFTGQNGDVDLGSLKQVD